MFFKSFCNFSPMDESNLSMERVNASMLDYGVIFKSISEADDTCHKELQVFGWLSSPVQVRTGDRSNHAQPYLFYLKFIYENIEGEM